MKLLLPFGKFWNITNKLAGNPPLFYTIFNEEIRIVICIDLL